MVQVTIARSEHQVMSVCIILSADDTFEATEGLLVPDVALTPAKARIVAYQLLLHAEELEASQ